MQWLRDPQDDTRTRGKIRAPLNVRVRLVLCSVVFAIVRVLKPHTPLRPIQRSTMRDPVGARTVSDSSCEYSSLRRHSPHTSASRRRGHQLRRLPANDAQLSDVSATP